MIKSHLIGFTTDILALNPHTLYVDEIDAKDHLQLVYVRLSNAIYREMDGSLNLK